ncbi:exostosin-like 3 isoform X2 [Babylonia areolata]
MANLVSLFRGHGPMKWQKFLFLVLLVFVFIVVYVSYPVALSGSLANLQNYVRKKSEFLITRNRQHGFRRLWNENQRSESCLMDTCFEFSRCPLRSGFPVYFYTPEELSSVSKEFVTSPANDSQGGRLYATRDPERACVFVVVVGTGKTTQTSADNINAFLQSLPHWNDGRNHLLINFGQTFDTDINTGQAVIAQPAFRTDFRQNYDIVIPPSPGTRTGDVWSQLLPICPAHRKYLVSFWGEYIPVQAESTEVQKVESTISSAFKDLEGTNVVVSCGQTPAAGLPSEWGLCGGESDRLRLLAQSSFTLLLSPLDHSLTSTVAFQTRLREALKQGAVPVILGHMQKNLPFAELLRWEDALVTLPLNRVDDVVHILRSFRVNDILEFRRRGRHLWETYFSTSERIVDTVLAALRFRLRIPAAPVRDEPASKLVGLHPNTTSAAVRFSSPKFQRNFTYSLELRAFNTPGSLLTLLPSTPFDQLLPTDPVCRGQKVGSEKATVFNKDLGMNMYEEQFTVVILTYKREKALMQSLTRLNGMPFLNKVVVVWNDPAPPSPSLSWPTIGVPVEVVKGKNNSLNNRFLPFDVIETDCVFSLDDDVVLSQNSILVGFRIWRQERDRIVGFVNRGHKWDTREKHWLYNLKVKDISMTLTGIVFLHKYYLYLYSYAMPQAIRDHVNSKTNCEDIAMNFLIAHVTRKPPITVFQSYRMDCAGCSSKLYKVKNHKVERDRCLDVFARIYGYMPLLFAHYRTSST